MNTTITIKILQDKETTVAINQAFEDAYFEFDRIVKQYTRFNEDSELSNLNRQSGRWIKVTDEFFLLIEKMLELAEKTNGAFDPTVIDFLEMYGYDKNYDFSKLDNPDLPKEIQEQLSKRKSWKDIQMNSAKKEVKLAENQRLDLGGLGKGYAIDCAAEKILRVSQNFLIDAGGDIRCHGTNDKGEVWSVGLKSFKDGEEVVVGNLVLNNSSIASSGSWARKVKSFHHLIDPATGKPKVAKYSTVFVQAPTSTESDGWATAIFINPDLAETAMPQNFKYFFS